VWLRVKPGPVFHYEWLLATRRWQLYALRAGFLAVTVAGMSLTWSTLVRDDRPNQPVSIRATAYFGQSLFETIISTELALVLLAAPAASAGAVCLDKARGTLDHILATDLTNAEIVLGKFGVRLVLVLGLIAGVLPILALAGLLGGIEPVALFGSVLVAIGCALVGCSLALLLSLWARKFSDVLMATYLMLFCWLISPVMVYSAALATGRTAPGLIGPIAWDWLSLSNPYFLVFAPYRYPHQVDLAMYAGFLVACLCLSGMLASFATLCIRAAASSQAGRPAATAGSGTRRSFPGFARRGWFPALPGPSLDGNPVLWREWHRSRASWTTRGARLLYAVLGVVCLTLSLLLINLSPAAHAFICLLCDIQVAIGLLLLSIAASTSLAEERAHGSLDLLLASPLPTHSILIGKWWGAFRSIGSLMIWAALFAGLLVAQSGRWFGVAFLLGLILSYGAFIASLGLALATWVSRLGRAVTLCVSAYVGFSIGWIGLVSLLDPSELWERYLCLGSPVFGAFWVVCGLTDTGVSPDPTQDWPAALLWTLAHGAIALVLFAATLRTFDRCVGRGARAAGHKMAIGGTGPSGERVGISFHAGVLSVRPE
jgi:ABC-type transport system involved in multi-copper enzyme maturation permease subunit